jgi:hypothetical protein
MDLSPGVLCAGMMGRIYTRVQVTQNSWMGQLAVVNKPCEFEMLSEVILLDWRIK